MPQKWHGTRMLPPVSFPRPRAEPRAAISAASPPVLPPGVRAFVPGVIRPAEDRVVALVPDHHLRQVRLAEQNGPGPPQPGDEQCVALARRNQPIADRRRLIGRDEAGLDRQGDAVQRAERFAAGLPLVGGGGLGTGLVEPGQDERV
jgi:hypothetical protein